MSESEPQKSAIAGKIVTVFGSSRPVEGSHEYEDARLIGELMASKGVSVCTGGYRGTMEAVSKGASKFDVKIIGVTSAIFSSNPNEFVNIQVHTRTLYERLQKLIELGDGYIILKGGTGTLLELAMVWELMNKEIVARKPVITVTDFWKPVVELVGRELASEGLESCAEFVRIARDASEAAGAMTEALNSWSPSSPE